MVKMATVRSQKQFFNQYMLKYWYSAKAETQEKGALLLLCAM